MGTDGPESSELDDLVSAAQGGDQVAFEELVRRTYVDVYTLAVRLTSNEEDARDVVQEAYLRAWKGIGRFRGDARFSTWMHRVTANAAYTYLGKRRRRRTEHLEDVGDPEETRAEALPDRSAESSELLASISTALDALPAKLRAVVVLKDVYGFSHEEIAEDLGISVAAAKVRLHRGRQKLQSALHDERGDAARAV